MSELPIPHSRPWITDAELRALEETARSEMVAEGEQVRAFESAMADYLGLRGGVATSSGGQALELALRAIGVGEGDEVVVPTYVCRAVWDAVRRTGADPVLCDVGEDWCVDRTTVEPALSDATRAIVPVHTFGIRAEVRPLLDLGVTVVEDACQALGHTPSGEVPGTEGAMTFLSFHATKPLCTAEGGMLLTDDRERLERIRAVKDGRGEGPGPRMRTPMTDLQASLGLAQLERHDAALDRRRAIAAAYTERLAGLPGVGLPEAVADRSLWFRYPLAVEGEFGRVREAFAERGVAVRRGVDTLLHRDVADADGAFPEAERRYARTLSIPIYPALSDREVDRVVEACREILG